MGEGRNGEGAGAPLGRVYGELRFGERAMRERLPRKIFEELQEVREGRKDLTPQVAEVVANAMKDWAIERGATHFTHWFQPLTGRTAEKHDGFLSPTSDGEALMEFSGKELVKGESDASSFPSGGLRVTFEARGYTAWDASSPAFLKEDDSGTTLYIPTAFVSYKGEALDRKVPLLRSIDALARQTLRVLRALGDTETRRAVPTVGAEQEYFLVERELFEKRLDLKLCGRTLYGAPAPKGQELEDHYYGSIPDRVSAFMRELNLELWRLGVPSKTQHKEVAPNQYEIASVYSTANLAADANQLVMETLQKVAGRHGLVALLHEKPFAGVNGSGKHNNWSLATDTGVNLLEPGANPAENARFLLFVAAIIETVDRYAPLLRATVAGAGNDLRLGANEAPPAIVSVFLGRQLEDIFEKLSCGGKVENACGETLEIGHTLLPKLPKDLSDRNRTSPFAFTGNKFEFRMPASSESISGPNTVLNAAMAEVLSGYADGLEKAADVNAAIGDIVARVWKAHRRVVFDGNGYSDEWKAEAARRGLPNLASTPEAVAEYLREEHVALLERQGVFTLGEVEAVCHIEFERYWKRVAIEAAAMVEMGRRQIVPSGDEWVSDLALLSEVSAHYAKRAEDAADLVEAFGAAVDALEREAAAARAVSEENPGARAAAYRAKVVPAMAKARAAGDALERACPARLWPFPGYSELLFSI